MSRSFLFLLTIVLSLTTGGCTSDDNDDSDEGSNTNEEEIMNPPAEEVSPEVISNFLWKPQSNNDGRLVVLVNPEGVRAEVTGAVGETLMNTGASNGRGSTLRGSFNGCSYGNQVKIEFFDALNRRIQVADGRAFVTVPQGCVRFEFAM